MGINASTGIDTWSCEATSKLLVNEKYTGDFLLGKTHVVNGIHMKFHDINQQVLMRGHHPAILSHEFLNTVQQE